MNNIKTCIVRKLLQKLTSYSRISLRIDWILPRILVYFFIQRHLSVVDPMWKMTRRNWLPLRVSANPGNMDRSLRLYIQLVRLASKVQKIKARHAVDSSCMCCNDPRSPVELPRRLFLVFFLAPQQKRINALAPCPRCPPQALFPLIQFINTQRPHPLGVCYQRVVEYEYTLLEAMNRTYVVTRVFISVEEGFLRSAWDNVHPVQQRPQHGIYTTSKDNRTPGTIPLLSFSLSLLLHDVQHQPHLSTRAYEPLL